MRKNTIRKSIILFSVLCLGTPASAWAIGANTENSEESKDESIITESTKTLDSLTNISLSDSNTTESTTEITVPSSIINDSSNEKLEESDKKDIEQQTIQESSSSEDEAMQSKEGLSEFDSVEQQSYPTDSDKETVAYLNEYFETEYVSSSKNGRDYSYYRLIGIKKLYEGNKIIIPASTDQDAADSGKIPVQFSASFFDALKNGKNFDRTLVTEISSTNPTSKAMYIEESSKQQANFSELFVNFSNLEIYNLSMSWNGITTSLYEMFAYLPKLTYVNLGFLNDINHVADLTEMFLNSTSLKEVYGLKGTFSNITSTRSMFYGCYSLSKLNDSSPSLTLLNSSKLENMAYMFYGCNSLPSLTISADTTSVADMQQFIHQTSKGSQLKSVIFNSTNGSTFSTLQRTDAMFQSGLYLTNIQINSEQPNTVDFSTASQLNKISYMFYDVRKITDIDIKINNSNVECVNAFSSEVPIPLIVKTDNPSLLSKTNYTGIYQNRYPKGPKFQSNEGTFNSPVIPNTETTTYYFDSCAISPQDLKLQLATFQQFKQDLKPTRDSYLFESWQLTEGSEPVKDTDLFNISTYTAQWTPSLENGNIPSQDVDNVKPDTTSIYGIAYIPKAFTIPSTKLSDEATQTISINSTNSYHVAVRDQRMTQGGWTLQAQLVWNNNALPGSSIQTANGKGEIKKNTNTGSTNFQANDLVGNDGTVTGKANVKIGATPSTIMTAQSVSHNGVYDYDLGNVSLVLENANTIQAGTYTGNINWNLTNAP